MCSHLSAPNRLFKVSSSSDKLIKRAMSRTIKVENTSVFGLDKILVITLKGIPLNPKGSTKKKEGTRIRPSFMFPKICPMTFANSSLLVPISIFCQFLMVGCSRFRTSSRLEKLSGSFSINKHISLLKWSLRSSASFKARRGEPNVPSAYSPLPAKPSK
ncbi:hypothetical protein ES703_112701 [subsurface metagenome]